MKSFVTPYDIVLEYLLSSEQAATIEEANYVMTEMDAETIQGIVERVIEGVVIVKHPVTWPSPPPLNPFDPQIP